ncbi:MAG: DUF5610 domain-containing protein [Aeromonadales bacterium]|nr:DUF5610 domain-containing protein [Aeromonadales bacterium]
MAISPLTGSQSSAASQLEPQVKNSEKTEQSATQADYSSSRAELKAQLNQGIVQAMFDGGKQGDDKAMNILYSEIMATINAELGEAHALTPGKVANQADDYWSPENTAGRIAEGALGFFEIFQKQNSKLSEEEQVDKFLSVITKSIDKGYSQATNILEGLKVFDGSIKSNAEQTRSIIDDKLAAFREAKLGPAEE